jgi:hypothetical protein
MVRRLIEFCAGALVGHVVMCCGWQVFLVGMVELGIHEFVGCWVTCTNLWRGRGDKRMHQVKCEKLRSYGRYLHTCFVWASLCIPEEVYI